MLLLGLCADPEGGGGGVHGVGTPPDKSQSYSVPLQYWHASPGKSQRYQHSILGHHRTASETLFKWRFAGEPVMDHF